MCATHRGTTGNTFIYVIQHVIQHKISQALWACFTCRCRCLDGFKLYNHLILTQYDSKWYFFQGWCATKVDSEGNIIEPGNRRICGPKCPLKDDAWKVDDTLTLHLHYDVTERIKTVKLFGILSSSLLLVGIMVTGLGKHINLCRL